jgi:formate hydrogenlyase transcriptional activator
MPKAGAARSEDELGRTVIESESLSRLAIQSLPSGVVILRPDGTILVVNHLLERQFGYTRDELVGQSVELLLPEALQGAHAAHDASFVMTSTARPMSAGSGLFGRRRDGSRFPIEVGLNPVQTENGTLIIAAVVDITARKKAEEASRDAVEEQLEFERLVAELSVQFINSPANEVDPLMRIALQRIGEALDLDRCTFFQILPGGLLTNPISWERPGIPPLPAPTPGKERFPWALETALAGEIVCFSSVDEIPNPIDRDSYRSFGTRSAVMVPLPVAGRIVGAVTFNMVRHERAWRPDETHRLRVFATVFGNVLARRQSDEVLQQTLAEIERLRDQLHAENVYLRREAQERLETGVVDGKSTVVQHVLEQVQQVASTDSTVLLLGETGTGKELFATQIHELSGRRARPMVRVNCAAIPTTLIESELFGREKGAFTGALARQIGRFELADHSTIFLDEIGDLPPDVQVKLLRVLEERQIERLGSPKAIRVDVRIIAATHRNLEQRIVDQTFREDLFYRLNVFPIHVPPLRERADDISFLVWRFVEEFSKAFGKRIDAISRENMAALQRYAWPGNVRELRNVVERAMILATGTRLTITLPVPSTPTGTRSVKLVDVEKEHIKTVLESVGWRIRGVGGAAERLGLRPTTLETRMAKLGLTRPRSRPA